jgi:DNA-binding transcriptional MerR regulator
MSEANGRFRIQVVSELTAVPAPTLRAWERRYGIPTPARTASAYRLYSDHDVAMVRRLRDLCANGMSIAEAARMVKASEDGAATLMGADGDPYEVAARRILDAIHAFDARSVEREVAPVSCGVFAPTTTLRELLMSDEVGAWARAIATRDVVIDPMPPWIAVAAGAGALRAVGRGARDVMAGLDALGLFGPFAKRAREIGELVGSVDVRAMLGFNPLDVVGAILRGSRNANEPGDDDHEP